VISFEIHSSVGSRLHSEGADGAGRWPGSVDLEIDQATGKEIAQRLVEIGRDLVAARTTAEKAQMLAGRYYQPSVMHNTFPRLPNQPVE
jgi:hypothetical protein